MKTGLNEPLLQCTGSPEDFHTTFGASGNHPYKENGYPQSREIPHTKKYLFIFLLMSGNIFQFLMPKRTFPSPTHSAMIRVCRHNIKKTLPWADTHLRHFKCRFHQLSPRSPLTFCACYTAFGKPVANCGSEITWNIIIVNQKRHRPEPIWSWISYREISNKKWMNMAICYENKLTNSQHFALTSLLLWSATSDANKFVPLTSWHTL